MRKMIMSTTTSYDDARDFMPKAESAQARRPSLLASLKTVLQAMSEGLSAAQRYRELTGRGVAPDVAARRVFADHFEKH
jgi:hypothetical protein